MLTGGALPAQEPASAAGVIVTVSEFWTVPEVDRQRVHAVRMELIVYYYDSAWKLLYGQTGQAASYLPVRGRALPMKSGQKVLLRGTVIPAEGLDGDRLEVTVLADDQLPRPVPVAGRMEDLAALNSHWVQLEGHVLSQNEPDPTHIEARVWSEGRLVNLTVQISGTEPVPQFVGARVRIRGVYDVAVNSAGGMQNIQFWTVGRNQIELLGWLGDDERFKLARTSVDQLSAAVGQPWVRVVGVVQSPGGGASLTVRDETGQIELAAVQPDAPPPGTPVEVVGRAAPAEIGWTLKEPLLRRFTGAGPAAEPPAGSREMPLRLRLAEQVVQLDPAEADRRHPVTLRGVVTWSSAQTDRFYVQDVSGGVSVRRAPGAVPEPGAAVVVNGVTVRGRLRPEVEVQSLDSSGIQPLPPPRRVSLEQALSGAEEGRWVEMHGYVRGIGTEGPWTRLDLTAPAGEFSAYLPASGRWTGLPGALIRVRGVCEAQPATDRELTDIRLWVPGRDGVQVEEPAPADPFARPPETVAGIRQAKISPLSSHQVRLSGTVLHHAPGRYLYLQDQTGGLFVLSRETVPVRAGQPVELVGLAGRLGGRTVLREARWRPVVTAAEVLPLKIEGAGRIRPEADARLVRLRATLGPVASTDGRARLNLQADGVAFDGILHDPAGWAAPEPGSLLELTGVYVLEYDEYHQPRSFRLELRTPADITVHETPPWWTAGRALAMAGGLALCTALGFTWVALLRRRVREQTEQIRRQLEKEARLRTELERSSRLESLGVLAGGIAHDFNNLLTGILGNLGLAAMDRRVMEAAGDCLAEAERSTRRARNITQQLLTFARGGEPVRTAIALPEIVTEAANFARHGSNVRFDFDLPSNLPPGDVDAGQISRVVHDLVINAVQAMPDGGVVGIALAAVNAGAGEVDALPAGSYLLLTIADNGRGIPPDVLPRIFDPYFSTKARTVNSGLGLATVRSIVKKHRGHIEVESQVGRGTTFRLWLPAAPHEMPQADRGSPHGATLLPARILVMDDEDVIRRVAGRMLALAGHEAVFASDGAEAVRAYVAARQSGRPFDLVIFDLTVPGGMGGKEALQELLKLDPDIRAIASSGYSSDPIMANPRAYGFKVSLPKPYDIPDLMRAVEEARRP